MGWRHPQLQGIPQEETWIQEDDVEGGGDGEGGGDDG